MNVSLKRAVCTVATSAVVASGLTLAATGPVAAAPGAHGSGPAAQAPAAPDGILDPVLLLVQQATQILGSGEVGSTLTRQLPVWNLLGVVNSTQWLADGVPVPGATGKTFVPSLDQAGQAVQAAVTGKLLGLLPVTSLSNVIPVLGAGTGGGTGGGGGPVDQLLQLLSSLDLLGAPDIGSVLSIAEPLWSLPGVSTAYQWFRDNVPIPGATGSSYVPSLEDAGREVYAQITGTLAGLPVVSLLTSKLPIPAATKPQLAATSAPSVTGTPAKVGAPLRMQAPTWNPADAQVSAVQWLRDGTPVPGATSTTYTPVAEDLGRQLSVRVTGHKEGYTDQTVASAAVPVQIGDAPTFTTQPAVSGRHAVGEVLTVSPGSWTGGQTPELTYQWNRDGRALPGATTGSYRVQPEDAGHQLSATVTAVRTGYQPGTFTTSRTTVEKVDTTTAARLAKKKVKQGKRARLVITVRADRVAPGGQVEVRDRQRTLRTLTVSDSGRVKVLLPKLKPGTHKLRAVYAGDDATTASTSKVAKLKVVKKKPKKHHRHR